MKITWSPLAAEQVRDISSYIALDKPSAAEQWIDKIFDCVEQLTDFPKSGRVVPELQINNIRELVQGNYRIIYKIQDNSISVLTVKSYRQQLGSDEIEL
ncbi:MAG: type II toxin-antitoxin system RelE/ParE family toxin [Pseudomonadales bacterium]